MKHLTQPPIGGGVPLPVYFRNTLYLLVMVMLFPSCDRDNLQPISPSPEESKIARINATEMDEILRLGQIEDADVTVQARISGSGYHAKAKGRGIIPSGEYAGQHFSVTIQGHYSDLGPNTLISGSAKVKIRGEKFESVSSTVLASFCCGEGQIMDHGTHFKFALYGQVEHNTASAAHNHLFAGFGSTLGTMNFNIADQSGTITEPDPGGPPPHDPGIGLEIDIPSGPVSVRYLP